MSSRFEASPNIFPESHLFGLYILSTPAGNAKSFLDKKWKGRIFDFDDHKTLSNYMFEIIENKIPLEEYEQKIIDYSHKTLDWNNIFKEKEKEIIRRLDV